MINRDLVHCDVHYWTVAAVAVVAMEVRLPYLWRAAAATPNANDAAAVFLFHFFARLEDRWEQTLILHKGTIMVVFTDVTHTSSLTARNVVFEITVKCLMFTILDFQVCKIATAMLGC